MEKYLYYFQAPNKPLYLNINTDGWAYWSPEYCLFTKELQQMDDKGPDCFYKLEYHDKYTGYYLSCNKAKNGYVGVYNENNKVAWNTNPLRVKNQKWKTYEYEKDGATWVCIGNYDNHKTCIARDLNENFLVRG
jgi:hypothetical protein